MRSWLTQGLPSSLHRPAICSGVQSFASSLSTVVFISSVNLHVLSLLSIRSVYLRCASSALYVPLRLSAFRLISRETIDLSLPILLAIAC